MSKSISKESLEILQRIEARVATLQGIPTRKPVVEEADFFTQLTEGVSQDEACVMIARKLDLTRNPLLSGNLVATLAFDILTSMEASGAVESYLPEGEEKQTYVRWAD